MHALAKASLGLVAAALLVAVPAGPVASESLPPTAPTMTFGMDAGSIAAQAAAGAKPDYGTFWIGPWTLTSGWGGPDGQLSTMASQGVTPAIHFYYWGDDISPSCVENGCYSNLHKAQKTREGWETLGTQLTDHLNSKMGNKPVVIFLESEFNKGGIETYEPFDGYMAAMAAKIHAAYPNAVVVLGFGNWGSSSWGTFDRAAAASDMVGIQGMRGSTKQSKTDMMTLYDGLLAGVKTLGTKFPGKDIMLTDIAVSSYPEPGYTTVQHDAIKEVFDNVATLQAQGVDAMIYRSWKDSPTMDTANYYGEAERHWGMAWATNGTQKAAGKVWVDGVKAERAGAAGGGAGASPTTSATAGTTTMVSTSPTTTKAPTSTSSSAPTTTVSASKTTTATTVKPYSASFTTGPGASAYWVEVKVGASPAPSKVDVKAGDGAWKPLRLRASADGSTTWGEAIAIAKGTAVQFRATAPDGQVATSSTTSWLTASSTGTSSAATTVSSSAFKATFAPKSVGNDWWVETGVSANQPLAKVEAKVGSTAGWTTLAHQDWGSYAKSVNAPNGTYVQFRVTSSSGATATSATYIWS